MKCLSERLKSELVNKKSLSLRKSPFGNQGMSFIVNDGSNYFDFITFVNVKRILKGNILGCAIRTFLYRTA